MEEMKRVPRHAELLDGALSGLEFNTNNVFSRFYRVCLPFYPSSTPSQSLRRSMTRGGQRGQKRSPTPSSTHSPINTLPPSSLVAPPPPVQKPLYLCNPFVGAALVKGNFKTIVMLPKYVDIMEWVAVNSLSTLRFSYRPFTEPSSQSLTFIRISTSFMEQLPRVVPHKHALPCLPDQSASARQPIIADLLKQNDTSLSYTWINQERKSVHLPAPTYIDYVMTWIQNLLDDENVFPTKSGTLHTHRVLSPKPELTVLFLSSTGNDFPQGFPSTIKHVYRQLLRVFAHIYHAHYPQILHLRSEPHFNSLFAHFLAFGREYELLEVKDVKGASSAPVGVGALWEKWREMGLLEG